MFDAEAWFKKFAGLQADDIIVSVFNSKVYLESWEGHVCGQGNTLEEACKNYESNLPN